MKQILSNNLRVNGWTSFLAKMRRGSAWWAALLVSGINGFGMLLDMLIQTDVAEVPKWPTVLSVAIGFGSLLALLTFHKTYTYAENIAIYLLNTLAVVAALFITDPYYLAANINWVPFQENKLGCFITALLAPTFAIGVFGIVAHAGSSIVNYYLFTPQWRLEGAGEPWASMAFGLAALCTLSFRIKRAKLEEHFMRAHAEALAAARFARSFVALRHLMNTPLQSIELAMEVMRLRGNGNEKILEAITGSVKELNRVNRLLKQYEKDVQWLPEDDAIDADAVLRQSVQERSQPFTTTDCL